jgi:hypothetical protein
VQVLQLLAPADTTAAPATSCEVAAGADALVLLSPAGAADDDSLGAASEAVFAVSFSNLSFSFY